jgi:hypothetical protein
LGGLDLFIHMSDSACFFFLAVSRALVNGRGEECTIPLVILGVTDASPGQGDVMGNNFSWRVLAVELFSRSLRAAGDIFDLDIVWDLSVWYDSLCYKIHEIALQAGSRKKKLTTDLSSVIKLKHIRSHILLEAIQNWNVSFLGKGLMKGG